MTTSAATTSSEGATERRRAEPTLVRQFLAGGFGHPSPAAPTQNRLFTQLVGVWDCAFLFAWLQQETTDGGQTLDTDVHIACRRL